MRCRLRWRDSPRASWVPEVERPPARERGREHPRGESPWPRGPNGAPDHRRRAGCRGSNSRCEGSQRLPKLAFPTSDRPPSSTDDLSAPLCHRATALGRNAIGNRPVGSDESTSTRDVGDLSLAPFCPIGYAGRSGARLLGALTNHTGCARNEAVLHRIQAAVSPRHRPTRGPLPSTSEYFQLLERASERHRTGGADRKPADLARIPVRGRLGEFGRIDQRHLCR